jgi:hypothetical protein
MPNAPTLLGAIAITAAMSLGARSAPSHGAASRAADTGGLFFFQAAAPSLDPTTCPPGTLPDGDSCVRLPDDDDEVGAPEAESNVNTHRDPLGHWVVYDEIPRRPERPADYDAYRYPVPCERACVASGYDLDRSDLFQRRGRRLRQVGHGAVDLVQRRGTPVTNVTLDHQQGDAEVVYVGPLFGTTVVTRNTVREGGKLRDYLLFFGHLDAPAPGLADGARMRDGDPIGLVGDTGSPELVHLHLETRRVRDGVDPTRLGPSALVDVANSVVCDPRNVLPLR